MNSGNPSLGRPTHPLRSSASQISGVTWIEPNTRAVQPTPRASTQLQPDQVTALMVLALTVACSAMSVFDLYLLASGT